MQDIGGLFYVPQFISKEEEKALLENINKCQWSSALKRRTQHYGYKYSYQKINTLEQAVQMPGFFVLIKARIQKYIAQKLHFQIKFDQILINQYEPGQGISAHIDNKVIFCDVVANLSLNSSAMMVFQSSNGQKLDKMLDRRSLLILSGESRLNWKHSIPSRKKDNGIPRTVRVSITFRKTIKITKQI